VCIGHQHWTAVLKPAGRSARSVSACRTRVMNKQKNKRSVSAPLLSARALRCAPSSPATVPSGLWLLGTRYIAFSGGPASSPSPRFHSFLLRGLRVQVCNGFGGRDGARPHPERTFYVAIPPRGRRTSLIRAPCVLSRLHFAVIPRPGPRAETYEVAREHLRWSTSRPNDPAP